MIADDVGGAGRSALRVSRPAIAAYLTVFAAQVLTGLGIAVGRQFGYDHAVTSGMVSVYQQLGHELLVAAAMSVIVVETGGQVMVLAGMTREWLRRRIEQADERATARGLAKGRADEREYLLGVLRESHPGLEIPELEDLPSASGYERSPR